MQASVLISLIAVVGIISLLKTCDVSAARKVKRAHESTTNVRFFLDQPRLVGVLSLPGTQVLGLTTLGEQLLVVRFPSNHQVNVYNTTSGDFIRNITIPNSSDQLYDIVASSKCNCAYISDPPRGVLYRYNVPYNGIRDLSVDETCHGLSLTSDHNVILTLQDSRQIQEYTTYGSLVRAISLDGSIEHPQHSVQLSDGQFVVSHGEEGDEVHRVCIVDTNGSIIKCHGGAPGSGVDQLNGPASLAVDYYDNILVADSGNNRVVLFSSSLTYLGDIPIPGHTLVRPSVLHLDRIARRLYIGERSDDGNVVAISG